MSAVPGAGVSIQLFKLIDQNVAFRKDGADLQIASDGANLIAQRAHEHIGAALNL